MIFGRQPMGEAVSQRRTLSPFLFGRTGGTLWLFAMLFIAVPFAASSAGCGGSSSSSPGPTQQTRDAKVTGQVVDQYNNNSPVVGATVRLVGISTLTAQDGTFVIAIPSGTAGKLTVQSPSTVRYYSTGYANGQAVNLRDEGVPIPALTASQSYPVGIISILSETGPPPPPLF